MKRLTIFAALAISVLACAAGPAFAQAASDTTVTIPYGAAINDFAQAALVGIGIAVAASFKFLPAHIQWGMQVTRADQLIEKGFAYARSQSAEKLGGLSATIDVKNKYVKDTLQYAVDHYAKIVDKLGGPALFEQKIAARVQEWIEDAVT